MRSTLRRLQVALAALTAASALALLVPGQASAAPPCYTVYVNGQAVTVCPN
jgi:hypothetical protein